MSIVIFTGPTLSADEGRKELEAEYLPPAAQGDVYRAARKRPQVIGIIDGYFERVPSVWHKEILWAMSHGIHVFGSASLGALRAAELEAFGMEGVGSIFARYHAGLLEDDDEVAVAHATEEFGFRASSEAMVDIRFTLEKATQAGVIGASSAAAIETAAKGLFYPDRNYALISERALFTGLAEPEVHAFQEWLPKGRASLKRADALAMLRVIRERVARGLGPKHVTYAFENSSMWDQAWRLAGESYSGRDGETDAILLNTVVDELRLEGQSFLEAQRAAVLRCLAIKHSYVQGLGEMDRLVAQAGERLKRRFDLGDPEAQQQWKRANNLDDAQLTALLNDEARVQWIRDLATIEATGYLLDELRVSGAYPRLVDRALAKRSRLASRGLESPSLADVGLGRKELMEWYFEGRLGLRVPGDLTQYCKDLGFGSAHGLEQSVLREYCFLSGQRVAAASGR